MSNYGGFKDYTADKSYWDTVQETNADVPDINGSCRLDDWAVSAVSRAKSDSCREQITDVACRLYNNSLIPKKLPRFCQREGEYVKGEYLGCYTRRKNFQLFTPLSSDNNRPEACVEKCLLGGDKYAGPETSELKCWCGNSLRKADRLSEKSCATTCPDKHPSTCNTRDNVKVFSTGLAGLKFKETQLVKTEEKVRGMKPIRIVFVFTVTGRALRQIRRLLKAIYHVDHYYYIHVDTRADYIYRELLKLEDKFPNVRLARDRFASIWGGISLLRTHFSIMKTLLAMSNWKWDYYINLSETHYPIKTIASLTMYLQKYQGHNFILMINAFDPTIDKDKTFVECDEHMWLLGKQQLPEGITYFLGEDWLSLHRDFVEYAVTGTDPLLTGLKEMYRYTILPVESLNATPKFWSRKFEPIIDQEILNRIDTLLGIKLKGNQSVDRYWQNDFHVLDKPSSTTDLITTFAYSFIRRSMQPMQSCGLTDFQLIETHVLNVADKFDSYLVKFSTSDTISNRPLTLECRFSRIQRYRTREQSGIANGLETLKVGTNYDPKEEIFRNYPGFFGPHSTKLTLQYRWIGGEEGNVTFTWTDPSGSTVSTLEKHIDTDVSKGVDTLTTNSTSTLQTGVWKILVQTDGREIADLTFLVLQLSDNAGHWNGKDDKKSVVADIDALTAQFWRVDGLCSLEDIGPECPNIELCSSTEWSSMSPDPKSDFIIVNEIKSAK